MQLTEAVNFSNQGVAALLMTTRTLIHICTYSQYSYPICTWPEVDGDAISGVSVEGVGLDIYVDSRWDLLTLWMDKRRTTSKDLME